MYPNNIRPVFLTTGHAATGLISPLHERLDLTDILLQPSASRGSSCHGTTHTYTHGRTHTHARTHARTLACTHALPDRGEKDKERSRKRQRLTIYVERTRKIDTVKQTNIGTVFRSRLGEISDKHTPERKDSVGKCLLH